MQKKVILVTGGAGYVGSVLVPNLLDNGYEVRVLDNLLFGVKGLSEVLDRIDLIEGDILKPPSGTMDGVYGVIHLGGISSQAGASFWSPRYTDHMNHLGAEIVAQQAKNAGVERFVFASSCSVYSETRSDPDSLPPLRTEQDLPNMTAPYALSKRAAEEMLIELTDDEFRPTIFRKGTLFGFSPKMRYDLVINAFTKGSYLDRKLTVHAGGKMYRPFVDIQDAVFAYRMALELPIETVGGQIFNLVGENSQVGELAKEFAKIVSELSAVDVSVEINPFEPTLSYQASGEKFVKTFSWTPTRSKTAAIAELWAQLEAGHDHTNPRYYNDGWYGKLFDDGLITNRDVFPTVS